MPQWRQALGVDAKRAGPLQFVKVPARIDEMRQDWFIFAPVGIDRKTERSMPHNPSLAFSPGGIALVYMWRRLGLASISARVDETRQDWFVFAPVGSDITRWATTRDISRDLAQTVLESSGVARAGSRAWRSAAVAWLRSGGFDLDDICKRGAWYKLDTVLEHYLRQKDPEPQVLERLFGRR